MDRLNKYYVFGVAADLKTQEVMALAVQKGVSMTLKDLQVDPVAQSDFLGRGHSRIPVVVQIGKPSFLFIGVYEQALAELNKLSDVVPVAAQVEVTAPVEEAPVKTEEPAPAVSEIATPKPIPDHGEDTELSHELAEVVAELDLVEHHIATFENEGGAPVPEAKVPEAPEVTTAP